MYGRILAAFTYFVAASPTSYPHDESNLSFVSCFAKKKKREKMKSIGMCYLH